MSIATTTCKEVDLVYGGGDGGNGGDGDHSGDGGDGDFDRIWNWMIIKIDGDVDDNGDCDDDDSGDDKPVGKLQCWRNF